MVVPFSGIDLASYNPYAIQQAMYRAWAQTGEIRMRGTQKLLIAMQHNVHAAFRLNYVQ